MVRVKAIAVLVLAVAVLVIVLQNTQAVETKVLFMTVTMPRAALLALTLLTGIVIGTLIALGLAGRSHRRD